MSSRIVISIKGAPWTISLMNEPAFIKRFELCSAITIPENKQIFINKNCLTPGTLRHELLHALVSESHVESAELSADQLEEICCTLVDFQWYNIDRWVEEIMVEFLKPKKAREISE